jgi:hypothetical protein
VGYQLQNIKKALMGKASMATLVIAPLVVAGLGLLGFQTYSLITGKSFKDIDFDIGRLWETKEEIVVNEPIQESDIVFDYRPTFIEEIKDPSFLTSIKRNVFPEVSAKEVYIIEPNQTNEGVRTPLADFKSLEHISNIDISFTINNPVLAKYYNRLEQEYLINPNITPHQGKWYAGFSFSPTINYRTFGYDPTNVNGVKVVGNYRYVYGLTEDSRNTTDKAITSYSIGFDFGRRIGSRWYVNSGLHYAQYGEQIQICAVDHQNPNYSGAEFLDQQPLYESFKTEDTEQNIPYTNRYSYVEVPIGVNYDALIFDKSKISINAGIHLQKLDHVNALVYDFNTDYYYWITSKEEVFRMYGVGMSAGFTVSQFVGERLEMFINPHFKTNLNSTFKQPYPVSQNQYSTGLRIGFKQQIF